MTVCRICRSNADIFRSPKGNEPILRHGERCQRCNRTRDMEEKDLERDTEP